MKAIGTVLLLLVVAGPAGAQEELSPGYAGFFFDQAGTVARIDCSAFTVAPAYVVLLQPDYDQIHGYEFGYVIDGNFMITAIDLAGTDLDPENPASGYTVDLTTPLPTGSATVLATLSVFLLDTNPIYFTLAGNAGGVVDPAGSPAVLLDDGTWQPTCLTAWDEDLDRPVVCAAINMIEPWLKRLQYNCTGLVAAERQSWDAIKSMYR